MSMSSHGLMLTPYNSPMKLLFTLITLILILFFNNSYSQTANNTVSHNEKNIYYQALTQYVYFEKWERGLTLDTLYVEDDYGITDSLLLESGQTKFITLRSEDIPAYLKIQKRLILYKVIPLRYENGEFSVSLVPVLLLNKKKQITNSENEVSYRMIYKFDNNKFVFLGIEHDGI